MTFALASGFDNASRNLVDDLARSAILSPCSRKHKREGITMGNTINLKAADGHTLSAYVAGPRTGRRAS